MPQHAKLPDESLAEHLSPANDPTVLAVDAPPALDFDDDTASARSPARFGRLALWMASATALGVGVLGTVGYSMWFTHDQRVYSEAMTTARKTLGIEQPPITLSQTQSAGAVEAATPLTTAPGYTLGPIDNATATLADNAPVTDTNQTDDATVAASPQSAPAAPAASIASIASVAPVAQAATPRKSSNDAQQTAAVSRPNRAAPARSYRTSQAERRRVARQRSEPSLFARVGAFFHRVSYQQRNATNRQREEYNRP